MDIWDKKKRSDVMAKIRSKDTKPEWIVRRYLYSRGYRYRKNVKGLPGTPDIVLRKYGIVIFIHGCFWHGHEVDGHIPHSNVDFWRKKIERNKQRDEHNKEVELRNRSRIANAEIAARNSQIRAENEANKFSHQMEIIQKRSQNSAILSNMISKIGSAINSTQQLKFDRENLQNEMLSNVIKDQNSLSFVAQHFDDETLKNLLGSNGLKAIISYRKRLNTNTNLITKNKTSISKNRYKGI